jgi:threonine/homoserine/homoserine lactone efflux protein
MSSLLLPLFVFTIAVSVTPWPNNIMLTASGANYGFRRTIPHIVGICFGLEFVVLVVALGFDTLFTLYPRTQSALKIAGSIYLLYLAWKIASSKRTEAVETSGSPLTCFQAAAFQLLNPKALIMVVTAMSTFTLPGDEYLSSALTVAAVFLVVAIPAISAWTGFGVTLGRFLDSDRSFRVFNLIMGLLTASSVAMIAF